MGLATILLAAGITLFVVSVFGSGITQDNAKYEPIHKWAMRGMGAGFIVIILSGLVALWGWAL